MEKTEGFEEGVNMDVSDQLSITFLPNKNETKVSYNSLRLNFTKMGDTDFSICMTPCEALDIISALGIAVQFYLHNQEQYKNDVMKYLLDKNKKKEKSLLINVDDLMGINENKRLESYEDAYTVISKFSSNDKNIMLILSEYLDSIQKIKPEIYSPESYYLSFFDIFGIYDEEIKFLYEEICDKKAVNMIILFLGMSIGVISYKDILAKICIRRKVSMIFSDIVALIQKELPLFSILM